MGNAKVYMISCVKYTTILILLALGLACSKAGENKKAIDNARTTAPTVMPTPTTAPQTNPAESKYILNLFELTGKTPPEVEIKTGRPRQVKKAASASLSYDEERQYEVAPVPAPFFLLVRFSQNRAVQFMWAVPPQLGTKEPEEFVESFGFKIEDLEAQELPNAKSWKGAIKEIEFDEITAMKSSSNYSVLRVAVKK